MSCLAENSRLFELEEDLQLNHMGDKDLTGQFFFYFFFLNYNWWN